MYSTCIFCHSSLGQNEAIENFPVERRLAFDSSKGRLWAVSSKCGRWNLTPLEERWEAIEDCERLFRGTILRSSTDQIGLARIREGTDLIRIGKPLRPEFAAWRYGRYLRHRRRMMYAAGGITAAAKVAMLVASHEKVFVRVIPSSEEPYWMLSFSLDMRHHNYRGTEAVHLAHLVAPALNQNGGTPGSVKQAVQEIEDAGSPERYFLRARDFGSQPGYRYSDIRGFPAHLRLAFEMAAHEESERTQWKAS